MLCRWNPAAEYQALDRTHRLGQHRSITAVRFIVRGTVEERIVALQVSRVLCQGCCPSGCVSCPSFVDVVVRAMAPVQKCYDYRCAVRRCLLTAARPRPIAALHCRVQEKKRLVFEGTVGADQGSLAKLTEEDMRFLFG